MSHDIPKTAQLAAQDPDWIDMTNLFTSPPPSRGGSCAAKKDGEYSSHHKSGTRIFVFYCRNHSPNWVFQSNFDA